MDPIVLRHIIQSPGASCCKLELSLTFKIQNVSRVNKCGRIIMTAIFSSSVNFEQRFKLELIIISGVVSVRKW